MESVWIAICFVLLVTSSVARAFESDELTVDEEFDIRGSHSSLASFGEPHSSHLHNKQGQKKSSGPESDSKVQFVLEHAFGDSDFVSAGIFHARLKTSSNGVQTLSKLRLSRIPFTENEVLKFEKLLLNDDFYTVRLPSNVLAPPRSMPVFSSIKVRCVSQNGLNEHFVLHVDGCNILAINYGPPGVCTYPRFLKLPTNWSFTSQSILKKNGQTIRTPVFSVDPAKHESTEDHDVKPPEKTLLAKYWMYLIPLGLIVMNTITQAMNMAEDATGAPTGAPTTVGIQRPTGSNSRRR